MDECTVNQAVSADQPETRVVSIGGSMTIQYGGEIKVALLEAMSSAKSVQLNLQQVTEMDLIGLQLICSAHRASIAQHKGFSVMKTGNEAIEAAVQAVGFCRRRGCVEDIGHTCIWAEGGQ